jgi:hypothetical protein
MLRKPYLPGSQYPVSLKNSSWYPIALKPVQNIVAIQLEMGSPVQNSV